MTKPSINRSFIENFEPLKKPILDGLNIPSRITKLLTLALVLSKAVPASAEEATLACQYTQSSGFLWSDGRWKHGQFETMPPFFMKLRDGKLDPSGADPVDASASFQCSNQGLTPYITTCLEPRGTTLVYNSITKTGALALMYGAAQSPLDQSKDTVTVSLFSCVFM